ncbi:MAG: GAF domain-containing protein, partial [Anaerolineales bacterium]|nr:GAF domain-containing protein [Anaerolineales bacterium]
MTNTPTVQTLQAELEQRKRELKLINAIDHIRDTVHEPLSMLSAIVHLLAGELRADLCLLSLRDRDTGEMALKAMQKNNPALGYLDEFINRNLAQRAIDLPRTAVWLGPEISPELGDEIQVAAVPVILNEDEHLGSLLLVRTALPFSTAELDLLDLLEDHIDSAVVQGYDFYELEQRNKELETIYRIDHIRDRVQTFDDLLNQVLAELKQTLEAEIGFIMLYDTSGERLEARATTDTDLFNVSPQANVLDELAQRALTTAELVWENRPGKLIHSIICLPLILNDRIIGVLGVANRYGERGFGRHERRLLSAIGSQMDTAIFESMERRHLREVLG